MPLQIALAVWAFTHVAVIAYFNTLSVQNILGVNFVDGYHGYIGFWPAAITGVVALACAWMAAERWFTRAIFAGSMWILYIVSSLYESGHPPMRYAATRLPRKGVPVIVLDPISRELRFRSTGNFLTDPLRQL